MWMILLFVFGLCSGYLLATLAESFFHQHIGHAGRWFRKLQKKYPRILGGFSEAYRSHNIVHHIWTFFYNHVTQFLDEQHKKVVDDRLRDKAGKRIIEEDYGTTLGLRSTLLFVLPIMPVVIPIVFLLPWAAKVGFCLPVVIYPLMSSIIHPYLHQPYQQALSNAPWILRWLLATAYMRCVWRHHYLHHQYPDSNFNLLLGGDWLRGVHRRATEEDNQRMREIGLPVD